MCHAPFCRAFFAPCSFAFFYGMLKSRKEVKVMRRKVADKKEVGAFLTAVLRDEEANVKDRLKVSEYLLKLAEETEERTGTEPIEIIVRTAE